MRFTSFTRLAAFSWLLMTTGTALASEETQLIESINTYRSQAQPCANVVSQELPPLNTDPRLNLPASGTVDLQPMLSRASYPMVSVQAISLSGPRDAQSAMKAIQESFCQVVLDPQFVDVGVSRNDRDWRIVLARPLLTGGLGNSQAEGQKILGLVNAARSAPHQCGDQPYGPASPLGWNDNLATAAEGHTRSMANNNYFDHKGRNGGTPGDRAELAGYIGQQIGENIAAGQDSARKVVEGWLASPGHCANIMNPAFREMGAAYAVDPKSDAGIYWTALFGVQQ
ncbi:CAP domain-containing protein [Pseudomonas bohemica]|uniref:CAP domain-containing protein n=1 Tax=Pseudomonas bohemica TaxID=2044872 RepID=UPI000DA61515|nr:CAP domain-containing protein [Pseudomonas bohemica]